MEDTNSHTKYIVLCYIDFKGAFSSTNHTQLILVLKFMGLPADLTRLVSIPYIVERSQNVTSHTATPHPWGFAGEGGGL